MTRVIVLATLVAVVGCTTAPAAGPIPFGIGVSQGIYANPTATPAAERQPQTVLLTSGIPGESGVSSTSSALSGGGGVGGGGHGGGGHR